MRILLIRLRQIGDVVFTTPAVHALRRRFPDAHLTYVVEPAAAPIVVNNPHLNEVIVAPRAQGLRGLLSDLALARRLRTQRYDLAIDFHGGPRASLALLESSRAELQETVRSVAEVASKPAAEAAARAVAEDVMREALKVARDDEVASRQRVEENAIAVAERVGRELVKMACSASKVSRLENESIPGEAVSAPKLVEVAPQVTPPPPSRSAWAMPWLAGLTLAVVYLLYRSFA